MGFFFIARGLYIHERSILAGKLLYSYRITSSINVVDTIIGNLRHYYYFISFIVGSIQTPNKSLYSYCVRKGYTFVGTLQFGVQWFSSAG